MDTISCYIHSYCALAVPAQPCLLTHRRPSVAKTSYVLTVSDTMLTDAETNKWLYGL